MAMESPPFACQSGSYSAEVTRRAIFAHYQRVGSSPGIISGGLVGPNDLQLSAPSSGMSVNVSTGECIIGGTEGAAQGGYYARGSSTTNVSIAAASPSLPRIDTIVALVSDSGYTEPSGGSGNAVTIAPVAGTYTSGATLANLLGIATPPLSCLVLGYVLVPAMATDIVSGDILNVATQVSIGQPSTLYQAGPWQALALGTSVGAASGFYTPSARLESTAAAVVRLKGALENTGVGTLTGTLATVPSGLRPAETVLAPASTNSSSNATSVEISTGGLITAAIGLPPSYSIGLDGISYTLS